MSDTPDQAAQPTRVPQIGELGVEWRDPNTLSPYPDNPRHISDEAVERVASSLRMFGWQQPIVVDADSVIVVGHTRHQAALTLGLDSVPVHVMEGTPEEVREYRLVDNKTGEMSQWDDKALALELREFGDDTVTEFFPDADLEIEMVDEATGPTEAELDAAATKAETVKPVSEANSHTTAVECPKCFTDFQVRTSSLPGMSDEMMRSLINGETERSDG